MPNDRERNSTHKLTVNHIASDITFHGTIEFQDKLIISGLVEGDLIGEKSDLEITKQGEVKGKCTINTLFNKGKIAGQTFANSVHLATHSISHSDFDVKEIVIDKKALINGKITMPSDFTS